VKEGGRNKSAVRVWRGRVAGASRHACQASPGTWRASNGQGTIRVGEGIPV
jgi:hypothetical protein